MQSEDQIPHQVGDEDPAVGSSGDVGRLHALLRAGYEGNYHQERLGRTECLHWQPLQLIQMAPLENVAWPGKAC